MKSQEVHEPEIFDCTRFLLAFLLILFIGY